jgi:hypothetical protein
MHFHLPKPLHGWREFVGEVGIIVIGVLIALGAEQLVEWVHWRAALNDFRAAARHEVAVSLGTYDYRMRQDRCVDQRITDLQAWLDGWRAGRPRALTHAIGAPTSLTLPTSVWTSRDPILMSHMPLRERIALGDLYDQFANNDARRLDERQTWLELAQFDGATALDHSDMMRLSGLIARARNESHHITSNALRAFRAARAIGINPVWEDFPPMSQSTCVPILPAASRRRG